MKQKIILCLGTLAYLLLGSISFGKPSVKVAGLYQYIYEHNTKDLPENHYLKIETDPNGNLRGTYWGTSDDFDDAREGYKPGFFETKLQSVSFEKNVLKFKLVVKQDDFFASPITPFLKKKPKQRWDQTVRSMERNYEGRVEEDKITLTSQGIDSRTLKKVK